jgi:hypothetical protein
LTAISFFDEIPPMPEPTPLRFDMVLPNGQPLRFDMGPKYRLDGMVPPSAYPNTTRSLPNVAVPFPASKLKEILDGLNAVTDLFPVLEPVGPAERNKLQTIATGREPFVAEAFADAKAEPATVTTTINMADWALYEEQANALDQAESKLMGLLELVQGTKAVVGDHRYKNVRRYYDYLGGNLDVLPTAQNTHSKISKLFAKQGVKSSAAKKAKGGAA